MIWCLTLIRVNTERGADQVLRPAHIPQLMGYRARADPARHRRGSTGKRRPALRLVGPTEEPGGSTDNLSENHPLTTVL